MGNGSGAVLARRVDGAQLECASAARALAEGGTVVTAHGSGFSSASEAAGYLLCRVGGAARRARGATVVGVRAVGAPAGGVRCAFGEAAAGGAWAGWRVGAASSGGRCVSPASAVTGWVGVQLGGPAGLASSGGSFYYHGSLAVAGLSPPLGPERGGTGAAGGAAGGAARFTYQPASAVSWLVPARALAES